MENLSPMQQMIYTGQFGYNAPAPQVGFNVYNQSNMIPFGAPQQQPNGYVFQPIPQQQPTYANPYAGTNFGFNPYQQPQQQQVYGNPYAFNNAYGTYQNQYYGYQPNPYLGNMYGYTMGMPTEAYNAAEKARIEADKIMYRQAAKLKGREINEDWLEIACNPKATPKYKSYEDMIQDQQWRRWQQYTYYTHTPMNGYMNSAQLTQYHILHMSEAWHEQFDNHSLCEFLEDDLWQIQRNEFVRKYISPQQDRNLSGTYNSKEYNELLNMHRSSNPYVSQLLDVSKYDNNVDDVVMGMTTALDRQQKINNILSGKVPTFVSSEEEQVRRARFTNEIMKALYSKSGGAPPDV